MSAYWFWRLAAGGVYVVLAAMVNDSVFVGVGSCGCVLLVLVLVAVGGMVK